MNSPSAGSSELLGAQEPRACLIPSSATSSGDEALELGRIGGVYMDEWQEFCFRNSVGERADGKWAAKEVGIMVSRQNGKGELLLLRELAGLFLFGERLIIHSAHQFDTSLEAFRRLLAVVEDTPDFSRRVRRISRSHGEEGIELKGGQRIRFRTRTKGGGRGFTCDCLILDEAMDLPASVHGALMPTLSARPNPQVWYAGSAVDQLIHEHGVVFARIRERGLGGVDPDLAYFEWAHDAEHPDRVDNLADLGAWAAANPGLGIRITPEHVSLEHRSMDNRTFAVERLGVGDWPRTDGGYDEIINGELWASLTDDTSSAEKPVVLSFDVSPDRGRAAISLAGKRSDGLLHVETVDWRDGTGWIVDRLEELVEEHKPLEVICDERSPAAALIPDLEARNLEIRVVNTSEHAKACGIFYDMAYQGRLRHLGTPELAFALRGAAKRDLSDSWAWSRRNSQVDISPLVAATLALWGSTTAERPKVVGVAFG